MLHHYDLCPEQIVVSNILKEQLPLNYMTDVVIKYKQWVSTDRSNLEEHEVDFDDFLDKLSSMVFEVQNTASAFLKTLVNHHIKTRYPFPKSISYFSDDSPAQ